MANSTQSVTTRNRATSPDYWSDIARQWNLIGTPLRPCDQDLRFFGEAIAEAACTNEPSRVTILGVTPELFHLAQSCGADVSAVDRVQAMIDVIWPGPTDAAICGDWTSMPLETGSRDVVLCDGGPITLSYPHGLRQLAAEVNRVLVPGGRCVFRTFVQPRMRECADVVLRDLFDGNILNTNVLKLRLGMALQENTNDGVPLAEIWNVLNQAVPDLIQLAKRIGLVPEQLCAINSYRDCVNRYSFHTLNEFIEPFTDQPGGFVVESIGVPQYALGHCCPTITFRRNELPFAVDAESSVPKRPHFKI